MVEGVLTEIPGYQIEEPQADDIRYHILFSKPFGEKKKDIHQRNGKKQTLQEFLKEQFVFCQAYKISDKQKYQTKDLQMFSMQDTSTPIAQ